MTLVLPMQSFQLNSYEPKVEGVLSYDNLLGTSY